MGPRRCRTRRAEESTLRAARREQYDAARGATRLGLLEQEAQLLVQQRERQGLHDGTRFPSMEPDRRATAIGECDAQIAAIEPVVDRLRKLSTR